MWGGVVCNGAEAASAPAWNAANFPAYDTTGNTVYHYGKEGTEFYGFLGSTNDKYWELLATKNLMACEYRTLGWSDVYGHGHISYVNALSNTLMNTSDKIVMKKKARLASPVYMWVPEKAEFESNMSLAMKVAQNVANNYDSSSGVTWENRWCTMTATSPWAGAVWAIDPAHIWTEDHFKPIGEEFKLSVAPAFQLDLTKVLKVKSYQRNT